MDLSHWKALERGCVPSGRLKERADRSQRRTPPRRERLFAHLDDRIGLYTFAIKQQ
jgi:hypothetical protein